MDNEIQQNHVQQYILFTCATSSTELHVHLQKLIIQIMIPTTYLQFYKFTNVTRKRDTKS